MSEAARSRDAAARLAAQTLFDRPLVLEAGAGTGKTAALVARVVAWALGPGWERAERDEAARAGAAPEPEHVAARVLRRIVAITFTEAAAAEMGQRVSQALEKIERGEAPTGLAVEKLQCADELRPGRASALRAVLDQLRVHTIHAFCRRLLAEHPLEAGLHPHFAVDADESRQKAIVREVVEAALPALLEGDAFLALARAGFGPPDVEEALRLLLQQGAAPDALREHPLAPERVAALAADLAAGVGPFVALEAGRLEGLARAKRVSATAEVLRQLAERLASEPPRDAKTLGRLREWLGEVDFKTATLKEWGNGKFPKSADLGDTADELAGRARALHPLLVHLERLDLDRLAAAREVLAPLHAEAGRRMRARGVATFPSLLQGARDLLRDEAGVRRRVRAGIDQLLVDEFQDTDPVQCEVVRLLALDGARDERPGLFLVGDPKQSIYGWRNADLAAYEGFVGQVREAGGQVHPLVVNHRSAPPLLLEVARLIEPVMDETPGFQPRFEPLLPSPANAEAPGFADGERAPVEHWVSWSFDADGVPEETRTAAGNAVEARAMAAELAELHAGGLPWSAFGLLFRAGTDLETYLAELRRAGVPFAVEGDRSYFQRREIIEAAALVRCVLDPHDQLALLTLLRSAVVGVPDAALIPLWERELPARMADLYGESAELEELAALVAEARAQVPEDIPGIERVAGWGVNLLAAARSLALLRASFEQDAADRFVEKLRQLFFFEVTEAVRYLGAYRVANLDRFFRDLLAALRDGEGDPRAVLRGLREDVAERREAEEGRPREAVEDAVQVMTIHKAKGLDFEHVYLLQLHKGRGGRPQARVERAGDWTEYELLGARSLGYHRVEERREAVEEHERVRTLYVAATRAKQRLVLAGIRPESAHRPGRGSHVELLAEREGERPDLLSRASAGEARFDEAGARWVFPARVAADAERREERRKPILRVDEVRRRAEALARQRREAAETQQRPYAQAISQAAHEAALDSWREGAASGENADEAPVAHPGPSRDAAMAVGTAVHRVLERLDLEADLAAQLADREAVEDELVRGLPERDRPAALERANHLLDRLADGPLLERLREIAAHVVARELPVLLPADPAASAGAAAYSAGVIDLLYRDPATEELVVADYKTDRIAADTDLAELTRRYAAQGAGYLQAIREALALDTPPRFELWYLAADTIIRPPGA